MIVKANLRSGGSRLIAAAITIIVSVAFVVAVMGVLASFQSTMRAQLAAQYSGADLVVKHSSEGPLEKKKQKAIENTAGVKETQRIERSFATFASRGVAMVTVWPKNSEIKVDSGRAPSKPNEILFDTEVAKEENKKIGDQVELTFPFVSDPEKSKVTFTITGIGHMPESALQVTNASAAKLAPEFDHLRIQTDKSADVSTVQSAVAKTLAGSADVKTNDFGAKVGGDYTVSTEDQLVQEGIENLTGNSKTIVAFITAFIVVAFFVAVLVISNTFQVLVASRIRSLALLRAVGATRSQLRNATLAEGALLGLISSIIGVLVGWGASLLLSIALRAFMQSTFQTAPLPILGVVTGVAVGVCVTVAASFIPALKATRVSPIDALAPADIPAPATRFPWVRLVIGALLTALGLLGIAVGAVSSDMMFTLPGAFAAFCGVLVLSRVFVPPLVELTGRIGEKVFRSPTLGLVARNVKLAPRRTASTTAALLIGVTLVATIFMGAQTTRTTIDAELSEFAPIDFVAYSSSDKTVKTLENSKIVKDVNTLPGTRAKTSVPLGHNPDSKETLVIGVENKKYSVPRSTDLLPPPGELYIGVDTDVEEYKGKEITLHAGKKKVQLTLKVHNAVPSGTTLANADDVAALGLKESEGQTWVRLADDVSVSQVSTLRSDLEKADVAADGEGAVKRAEFAETLTIMMGIVLGLLGASVIISIVGVGNTLSLATIERKRETALLRTLGLPRWAAAGMVAAEATLMAIVSIVVGTALGILFGWASVKSLLTSDSITVVADIPWLMFGLVAVVTVLAALIASLLPALAASRTQPAQGVAQR